jgi:hypothetical protein
MDMDTLIAHAIRTMRTAPEETGLKGGPRQYKEEGKVCLYR